MKKFVVASFFLGLASVSQAAFIACTPPQSDVISDGVGGQAVFTCSPGGNNINGDGLAITEIRLRVSGTFQENAAPEGQIYSVAFTSTNNGNLLATGSFILGNVGCSASDAGDENNQALGQCLQVSGFVPVAGLPDSIPVFNVTVTGGAGSNPLPFNASASVAYEVNTVPEPATYTMLGVGLVGFWMMRRKS